MDPTIERLRQRYDQLARRDDLGFMRQLKTYLDTLDGERAAPAIIDDLRRDVDEAGKAFRKEDRELVKEAVAIRERLAADAPEIDDSNDPPPDGSRPGEIQLWRISSLRSFDEIAGEDRDPSFSALPYYGTPHGRSSSLIGILRNRLWAAEYGLPPRGALPTTKARDDLAGYETEIENLQAKYTAARRIFRQADLTLPGLADQRLRLFSAGLTPEAAVTDPDEDDVIALERSTTHVYEALGSRGILRRAVIDGLTLQAPEQEVLAEVVAFLRDEADRLHEEVIDRLRLRERSLGRRAVNFMTQGSHAMIAAFVLGVVSTLAALAVAWALDWVGGDDSKPPPSVPSAPTKNDP